jgi:hypothetical protein
MLYPMAQSVALVCVEIDKKMPLQWHCPLSSVGTMEKQNHFAAWAGSYQIQNETWKVTLPAILVSHQ